MTATIERLAHEGVKEMLVVPISFVTEHIETLHEINIEARDEAKKLGVETFRMMPALGDSPYFIAALKDLVLRAVGIDPATAAAPPTSRISAAATPPFALSPAARQAPFHSDSAKFSKSVHTPFWQRIPHHSCIIRR